jgi:hypothetical protein
VWDLVVKNARIAKTVWWILGLKREVMRDPAHRAYMDRALTPVREDDEITLDLLTKTSGVREALDHQRKVARLTQAARA